MVRYIIFIIIKLLILVLRGPAGVLSIVLSSTLSSFQSFLKELEGFFKFPYLALKLLSPIHGKAETLILEALAILSWLVPILSYHLKPNTEKTIWTLRESNPGELAPPDNALSTTLRPQDFGFGLVPKSN